MDRTCSTNRGNENTQKILVLNLKGRNYSGDTGVDERIILKRVFEK